MSTASEFRVFIAGSVCNSQSIWIELPQKMVHSFHGFTFDSILMHVHSLPSLGGIQKRIIQVDIDRVSNLNRH